MDISGQCFCGAISFKGNADPRHVYVCHCRDCQVFSGAPFRAFLSVPADQIDVLGTPKVYVKVAASGNHRAQAFCGECGTQLYGTEPTQPMVLNIRLGCVNERAQLTPTVQVWQVSAMPWLRELSTIPSRIRGSSSPLAVGMSTSGN